MTIPEDIYVRVHELALAIVNASAAGDEVLNASNCEALRAYFDDLSAAGRFHPFLTEAVADFTKDTARSVQLYRLALEQSKGFPDEPTHTKMISLATQLILLGNCEQAEAFLRDGREEAVGRGDAFWIHEAERWLGRLRG